MDILIWINTLALLAAAVVTVILVRDIQRLSRETSANLRDSVAVLSANMKQAAEALSRLERISLATLERVAGGSTSS